MNRFINAAQVVCALVAGALCASVFAEGEQPAAAAKPKLNPAFFYFYKGEFPGYRSFFLGDPTNWSIQVKDKKDTKSAGDKLKVSFEDYQGEKDALYVKWNKRVKENGQLSLYGPEVDLSAAKDLTALTFDMMLMSKPTKGVELHMDCNYPCRATAHIGKILRKYPTDEWLPFFMPLNCFKSNNFDLSKINGPFGMATTGGLEMKIANIRLERLPAGNKGCTD